MRWITLYLAAYFMLLAGAAWAIWESGILAEIPAIWIVVAALVAVSPALMLAGVSHAPTTPTRS